MFNSSCASQVETTVKLCGVRVIADLQWMLSEFSSRAMEDSVKWVLELLNYLPPAWLDDFERNSSFDADSKVPKYVTQQNRSIQFGLSLLRCREFPRAQFIFSKTQNESSTNKFLFFWSRFLQCLREQAEFEAESFDHKTPPTKPDENDMAELLQDMYADKLQNPDLYDAFMLYLLGKVEASLVMQREATRTMKSAIENEPRLWPAWQEMVNLVKTKDEISSIQQLETQTTHSWLGQWFTALINKRFHMDRESIAEAEKLKVRGFGEVPMILSHIGACANHMLDHDRALTTFHRLRDMDPLRLENMHLYSDSLFCRGERVDLADLTHSFYKSHKFEWETCCIVGNYYNLRGEHEQAIRFFQRAIRLNPRAASIWVLIGHEFLELKNSPAACLSYRKAVELEPADYRGWYGLGMLYDILKMHSHATFYYEKAHKCKPRDSRMLVALGLCYSKNGRLGDAQRCFTAAYKYGDVEGTALWNLAKLFEQQGKPGDTARTMELYLTAYAELKMSDDNSLHAIRFLAKYYCSEGDWEKAKYYAELCMQHATCSDDGRSVLREISLKEEHILQMSALAVTSQGEANSAMETSAEDTAERDMVLSDGDAEESFD